MEHDVGNRREKDGYVTCEGLLSPCYAILAAYDACSEHGRMRVASMSHVMHHVSCIFMCMSSRRTQLFGLALNQFHPREIRELMAGQTAPGHRIGGRDATMG